MSLKIRPTSGRSCTLPQTVILTMYTSLALEFLLAAGVMLTRIVESQKSDQFIRQNLADLMIDWLVGFDSNLCFCDRLCVLDDSELRRDILYDTHRS